MNAAICTSTSFMAGKKKEVALARDEGASFVVPAALLPLARSLFVGVRHHCKHHRTSGPPYQQFFGYLDDALMAFRVYSVEKRSKTAHAVRDS